MRQKMLKESSGVLSKAEIATLRSLSSETATLVANIIRKFREQGKEIDIRMAAEKANEIVKSRGQSSPELDRLAFRPDIQAPPDAMMDQQAPLRDPRRVLDPNDPFQRRNPQMRSESLSRKASVLSKAEIATLRSLAPNTATAIANIIRKARSYGKEIDIRMAAEQLNGFAKARGQSSPELDRLMNRSDIQAPPDAMLDQQAPQRDPRKALDPNDPFQRRGPQMRRESLSHEKSRIQLREAIFSSVLTERKRRKKMLLVKESILQQVNVGRYISGLLREEFGSSAWGAIKDAATPRLDHDHTEMDFGHSDNPMEKRKREVLKKMVAHLEKVFKKASQQREQFNSQVLKNKSLVMDYYESVIQASEEYQKLNPELGGYSDSFNRKLDEIMSNLRKDFMSEVDQIKMMLDKISDEDQGLDLQHQEYREKVEEDRERNSAKSLVSKPKIEVTVKPPREMREMMEKKKDKCKKLAESIFNCRSSEERKVLARKYYELKKRA